MVRPIQQTLRSLALLALAAAVSACGDVGPAADSPAATDASITADSTDDVAPAGDATMTDADGAGDGVSSEGDPTILAIEPDHGSTGGLVQVQIKGLALDAAVQVYFGESPALTVQAVSPELVVATSPPRPSGVVDVTVRSAERPDAVFPFGFRYIAQVAVVSVSPTSGAAAGGTPLVVKGKGFVPGTRFVVGARLAIDPVVLDEETAAFVTPPGAVGPVTVAAVNGDGVGVKTKAFTYRAAPKIDSVQPGLGPVTGGTVLTVTGAALATPGTVFTLRRGPAEVLAKPVSIAADGSSAQVTAPATGEAGSWDLAATNADGEALLSQAFTYVDGASPALSVLAVAPGALPSNQPRAVMVAVGGATAAAAISTAQVKFGGQPAQVLDAVADKWSVGATLRVLPAAMGNLTQTVPVDVEVTFGSAKATKVKGFTWLPAAPVVTSVQPESLSSSGGTSLQVRYAPKPTGWGAVTALRVGASMASQVQPFALPDGTGGVGGVAPPGAPGRADLVLFFANGQSITAPGAVEFRSQKREVAVLLPTTGAQAGGTWVQAVGSGLDELTELKLGSTQVPWLQVVDTGLAYLRTPKGEPGPADLVASFQILPFPQVLPAAFTYFDPVAGDAGTWGPTIDGTVNVTVVAKGKNTPISGAFVTLGADPKTPFQGLTDDRGQITFSAPGLQGPVHVHAAKAGHSAGSYIGLNVENVTIRLQEFPSADSGNGGGDGQETEPPLPDGLIQGVVIDAAKYTQLPLGSCETQPVLGDLCLPCTQDLECSGGTTCEQLHAQGTSHTLTGSDDLPLPGDPTLTFAPGTAFCLAPCTSNTDCAQGYECRSLAGLLEMPRYRCVPQIGVPETQCETTATSIFGGNPSVGPGGTVDASDAFSIVARPGEVAVVCWSGYVDAATGEFVPLVMGMARKLFVYPGQTLTGVKVPLKTPLDRRMRVRMQSIPMGPDAVGGRRSMTAGLDLGAEGYVPMGTVETLATTDVLEFLAQPSGALFQGDGQDIRYELYGGVANLWGGPPNSTAVGVQMDVRGLDHFASWTPGDAMPIESTDAIGRVDAMDAQGGLRVAVGEGGRVLTWSSYGFTPQASPTQLDLRAVWLPGGTSAGKDGWLGGRAGVLARFGGLGWKAWPQLAPDDVAAIHGRAAEDAWLVAGQARLAHWDGLQWTEVAGPWKEVPPPDANGPLKAPPHRLRGVWQAPTGSVFLVGDQGTFLRGTPSTTSGGKQTLSLTALAQANPYALHAIWGTTEDDVWVAGDKGRLGHWNGQGLKWVVTGVEQPLYAIRGEAGQALQVVGGQGTWLRVTSAGPDGPFQVQNATTPLLRADLRGVVTTGGGGWVAAGQPVVVMGPYLEMPYIQEPKPASPLGDKVIWTQVPGVMPTLNIVRIADSQYTTRWEIFVRGSVTQVALPDFQVLGKFDPVPPGPVYVRVWRVLTSGLDIDHFNSKQLNMWSWTSWAYNVNSVLQPNDQITKPSSWKIDPKQSPGQQTPPPKPGPPGWPP